MYWIALHPLHEDERCAWGWRALRFTPRVAQVEEALVLEASAALRLWGGRESLAKKLFHECQPLQQAQWAQARTALVALGRLRVRLLGKTVPARPQDLPLEVLSAARDHVPTLERIGCRNWGDLRALPRGGVARRFGAGLLEALDCAFGASPESFHWLELPQVFDLNVELASLATTAPELMWSAQRLLSQLQVWLQARHHGVLALELEWTLDLRRLNGLSLPSHQQLTVRTAQPTQDVFHLRRLVGEHLARATLAAPVNHLRLRTVETLALDGGSKSLLPEDNVKGERLHQLIERLGVRLGAGNIVVPLAQADHRPERMQVWQSAAGAVNHSNRSSKSSGTSLQAMPCDGIYPPWLLPHPLRLEVHGEKPHYHGPLRLLAGPQRLETGWWDAQSQGPALRDYFIARSDEAGLLWVFRERLNPRSNPSDEALPVRWYLHGVYA
jgi:protein ImuB